MCFSLTLKNVALRIRPLTDRDRAQPRFANLANDDVLKAQDKTVQVVSQNKYFTFDHVFGTTSTQEDIFKAVGDNMIRKFIEGYNITILAYGQTSSGKTYTMGTAAIHHSQDQGIVPRSMSLLFDLLQNNHQDNTRPSSPALSVSSSSSTSRLKTSSRSSVTHPFLSQPYNSRPTHKHTVTVSFIEIYNEELHDLLNSAPPEESPPITIREDTKGNIYWTGVKEVQVQSAEDVLYYLDQGTQNRATGATDMNEKSSRSHAIFSVTLRQEKLMSGSEPKRSTSSSSRPASSLSNRTRSSHTPKPQQQSSSDSDEWMITVSKFHFVDLAGSERLKRTAAEGDRRKEGININAGLLALGNVISALASDASKKKMHIPYRDSKLTRLLQDSLGGNATTLMIACVSPAEYNLAETLNTLQYANRARNIKNRSEKNEVEEWMTSDNIELLRSLIGKLKHELRYLKSVKAVKMEEDSDEDGQLEQRLLIADLQRQVEELDGEATVTRERNRVVEKELQHLRMLEPSKKTVDFQHLVEPVIEEYEKSISNLESQLALTKAALSYSDIGFEEQLAKIQHLEGVVKSQEQTVEDLKSRLTKVLEREQSNESYILELETKLMASAKETSRDQEMLNDLRARITKLKETDENAEQYIHDLEQRLALGEAENKKMQKHIEALEAKVEAKERTNLELLKRLKAQATSSANEKLRVKELDQVHDKLAMVEKERDLLKQEIEQWKELERKSEERSDAVRPTPTRPDRPRSQPSMTSSGSHQTNLADEKETGSSAAAFSLMQAEAKLKEESDRAERLERTLDRLQMDHQETLKELDEVLQRYHEALEQLDFMDASRSSSTTHEEDVTLDLSKEISIAKEVQEKQEYLSQITRLQEQLGLQEKELRTAVMIVQQELETTKKQLDFETERRVKAEREAKETAESLERQIQQLTQDVREREDEMGRLRDRLGKEAIEWQRRLEASDGSLESCQRQLAESLARLTELKAAHEEGIHSQRTLQQQSAEKIQAIQHDLQQKIDRLEDSLEQVTQEKEMLSDQFKEKTREERMEVERDYEALLEQRSEKERKRLLELEEKMDGLERDRERMAREVKRLERELRVRDEGHGQLKTEYDRLKDEMKEVESKWISVRTCSESDQALVKGLREQLAEEDKERIEEKIKEMMLENERLRRQREEDEEIQLAMDEECEKLKKEKEEMRSRMNGLELKEDELQRTIVDQQEKMERLEAKIARWDEKKEMEIKERLEKETRTREEGEKKLKKLQSELLKSKSNGSIDFVYEDRIQQLEKQMMKMTDENAEYSSLSEELEKEINRMREEQEELVSALDSSEDNCIRFQGLIKEIKSSLGLVTTEDDNLVTEIKKIKAEKRVDSSRDEWIKLKRENEKLNEEKEKMRGLEALRMKSEEELRMKKEREYEERLRLERERLERAERLNLKLEKQLEEVLKSKKAFICF
ncbi:hypothetical protein G6F36_003969 [Rhizopus arrhizus]|nr:hypothetical protein G6F36_003969 [Rhizopus arrhizus]